MYLAGRDNSGGKSILLQLESHHYRMDHKWVAHYFPYLSGMRFQSDQKPFLYQMVIRIHIIAPSLNELALFLPIFFLSSSYLGKHY
jgi:hypothetical protein